MVKKVESLEKLGEAYNESLVPRPKLPEITGLVTDEAVLQALRQGADEVRHWTISTLAQLENLDNAPREIQEHNEEKVAEAKRTFQEYLEADTKTFRRACWLGSFEQRLSAQISSRAEAQAVITSLVQEGLIEKVDGGPLKIYGETYAVPSRSTFKEPELIEVAGFIAQLVTRALQAERQARTKKSEELFGQNELSLNEFLAGKAGLITFGVPPEEFVDKDGQPKWRGGGTLLVQSDGKKVWPLGASGTIQRGVEEAMSLNVHLLSYALSWEWPPKVPDLDEARAKKLTLLWFLLKRGIDAMQRSQAVERAKEEMIASAESVLSPEAFFLKGEVGVCLVEFHGTWEPLVAEGERPLYVPDLFFLTERFTQGEGAEAEVFVRLVATPPHINGYLDSCTGVAYPEGDKFSGVAPRLRAVLQAIYGQTARKAQLAERYPRDNK